MRVEIEAMGEDYWPDKRQKKALLKLCGTSQNKFGSAV